MGGVLTRDPLPKVSMKRGTNVVDNWPFTIIHTYMCMHLSLEAQGYTCTKLKVME